MPVDPNAIATWANAVTVGRVLIAPVLFAVIPDDKGGSWFAFVLWFLLCASDTGLVDEHGLHGIDQLVAPASSDAVLQLAQLGEPLVHQLRIDGTM